MPLEAAVTLERTRTQRAKGQLALAPHDEVHHAARDSV